MTSTAPHADLLELVSALRSAPEPQARPEFVADLRERLMVAAAAELTPVPAAARHRDDVARLTIKPVRTRRERRLGIALGAVAIIGATTSMAVASQGALPGDALYPVKRAIENTQAGFSRRRRRQGRDDPRQRLRRASTRSTSCRSRRTPTPSWSRRRSTRSRASSPRPATRCSRTTSPTATSSRSRPLHELRCGQRGPARPISRARSRPAAHDALLNAAQTVARPRRRRPCRSVPSAARGSSTYQPRCWPAPPVPSTT